MKLETVAQKGNIYFKKSGTLAQNRFYRIINHSPFSSIAIQISVEQSFNGAFIVSKEDTFLLTRDEHVTSKNGLMNANLISFASPISEFTLYSDQLIGQSLFHFIQGGTANLDEHRERVDKEGQCFVEPGSVNQNSWRAGLSLPSYNRSFSNIKHVIIHHSAGSNTNTNFTQVVRDIYIYHKEVNGWSDIGYNYLIAQDGTIFKGRDPDSGEQDNVTGAHFCGMNSGTMGVCLLGTYTDIMPTDEAVQSLFSLISWKIDKESLNAYEGFSFNSISQLGTISGHRDGCATECPGTRTYEQLSQFKHQINQQIEDCYPIELSADFELNTNEVVQGDPVDFLDTSMGSPNSWNWMFEGTNQSSTTHPNPSNIIYSSVGEFTAQLIIRNGSRMDTAQKMIKVNPEPTDDPIAFPNPINAGESLFIKVNKEKVDEITITDVSGNKLIELVPVVNEFPVNNVLMKKGIYFFRFMALGKTIKTTRVAVLR